MPYRRSIRELTSASRGELWLFKPSVSISSSSCQVTGLGTALKILFSGEFDRSGLTVATEDLKLSRNEIVALFNSFGKLSTSIVELERFREMMRKRR